MRNTCATRQPNGNGCNVCKDRRLGFLGFYRTVTTLTRVMMTDLTLVDVENEIRKAEDYLFSNLSLELEYINKIAGTFEMDSELHSKSLNRS